MATIYFVDGEKGGVGKSMFSRCLAHYFECEGIDCALVDADSNNDVAECYDGIRDISFKVANEEIALSSLEVDRVDRIFELALEKPVLVNLPANVHEQVAYWIESNDLLSETFMRESGVEVVKWFLCSGEYDSLQAFANSLKAFSGRLSHIFVRNLGLHTNWSDVEKSPLYREAKKQYEFREIEFPGLRKAEQMHVQQSRVPMSLLREDESLSILSKQRLTKFLRQTAIAIQKSGAIATPQPPETDG